MKQIARFPALDEKRIDDAEPGYERKVRRIVG
jgi:hypothetical protein